MRKTLLCGMAVALACSPDRRRYMALVQTASHIDALSGKVGNAVYTKARNGATMRKRVKPSNPRTAAQVAARASLGASSKAFSALTPSQRTAWDGYAASVTRANRLTGNHFALSAISAFTAISAKLRQLNPSAVIPLTPPATPFAGDVIAVSAAGAVGKITVSGSAANAANVTTEILLVKVQSANRRPSLKAYRHKAFVAFAAGALSSDIPLAKGIYALAYKFCNLVTGEETTSTPIGYYTVS